MYNALHSNCTRNHSKTHIRQKIAPESLTSSPPERLMLTQDHRFASSIPPMQTHPSGSAKLHHCYVWQYRSTRDKWRDATRRKPQKKTRYTSQIRSALNGRRRNTTVWTCVDHRRRFRGISINIPLMRWARELSYWDSKPWQNMYMRNFLFPSSHIPYCNRLWLQLGQLKYNSQRRLPSKSYAKHILWL